MVFQPGKIFVIGQQAVDQAPYSLLMLAARSLRPKNSKNEWETRKEFFGVQPRWYKSSSRMYSTRYILPCTVCMLPPNNTSKRPAPELSVRLNRVEHDTRPKIIYNSAMLNTVYCRNLLGRTLSGKKWPLFFSQTRPR